MSAAFFWVWHSLRFQWVVLVDWISGSDGKHLETLGLVMEGSGMGGYWWMYAQQMTGLCFVCYADDGI